MFNYAQLDENNICVCQSVLSGNVDLPNMIILDSDINVLGKRYNNGIWEEVPIEPIPPQQPSVEEQILANTDATMLGVAGNLEETIAVQQNQVKSDGDLQAVMLGMAGLMEEILKLQIEVATLKGGNL